MSFGISNNVRSEVRVCTPDLLAQTLDAPLVARTCAEIEDALEAFRSGKLTQDEFETLKSQLKKRLPVFTFHATFKNGRRKNGDAIPSGLSIYDLDHIPNPHGKWAEIAPRVKELGIVLAHVTPSTEGLRLVFVIPGGMSLADAQAWMARQLGDDKYDACVKDYARSSFAVPREYVLWADEERLFADRTQRHEDTESLNYNVIQTTEGRKNLDNTHVDASEILRRSAPLDDKGKGDFPQTYESIPYEQIIETLEEQMGGRPEHGSRNNFIFSMACHLRYVCNDDASWIAQVLPTYGENREKWMSTIRSACNRNQTKQMPRIMCRTLAICKSQSDSQVADADAPPAMPRKLPPLIRLLVSKTPKIYQPAVAHAVFPALATHLWRTTFRYIDNVEHEATLMCCLMAGTGAGKNCISEPINRILKDIRQRDMDNLQREKEWKREMQTKGANKDKRQRPEGLVIQEIDPDITAVNNVPLLENSCIFASKRIGYDKGNSFGKNINR